MKSLFDKNDRYTEEALYLDYQSGVLLAPLMREYKKLGYSAREIAHIVTSAISLIECELVMDNPKEKDNV